eukprot:TRINITY_DN14416_c0_g1_i1.p1 TRINITY_DN14416_c0_g1~~TRINITY_DN14416_c0_g1_i1.p1  ORF type:complete len:105 (-),score=21.89 TRINITY_DN14416_c0_g1_i1:2-316(-)
MYMDNHYEIPFVPHESNEDSNQIMKIECCRLSAIRVFLFVLSSLTVVPLLLYECMPKIRRFLFYSLCSFKEATHLFLSLIHISEPTRPLYISYAVFCLKKKKKK